MSIRLVSSVSGVTRIDFEGRIAQRALEIGSQVLPAKEKEFRDKLLANFRQQFPTAMKKVPKGAGVPSGYYVFDMYTDELRDFLKDEKAHQAAESDLKAARYYGAGRKLGSHDTKAFTFDIEIVEGEPTQRFEGSHADMKNIMTVNIRENVRLQAENTQLLEEKADLEAKLKLATAAAVKLRDQMLAKGLKPRYSVRAGSFSSTVDPTMISTTSPQEFRA